MCEDAQQSAPHASGSSQSIQTRCLSRNEQEQGATHGIDSSWAHRPVSWAAATTAAMEHTAAVTGWPGPATLGSTHAPSRQHAPYRRKPIQQQLQGRTYQGVQAPPLKHSDIVHAIVTSQEHEHLALESRLWRQVTAPSFNQINQVRLSARKVPRRPNVPCQDALISCMSVLHLLSLLCNPVPS